MKLKLLNKNSVPVRLLKYVKPHWKKLSLAMVLASIVSLSTGSIAWIVQPILDEIFLNKNEEMLMPIIFIFIAIHLVKGLGRYGQTYFMRTVGLKVVMKIRNDLYTHILHMPISFFNANPSSMLMSRVTNDVMMVTEVATSVVADFVRQTITFVVLLGVLLYRDWLLTLVALCVFPLISQLIVKIGKKLKDLSKRNQEKMATMNAILQETFTGTKIVKAFVMEEYEKERFIKENNKLYKIGVSETKHDELVSPMMEFFSAIGFGLVIWYGGGEVIKGTTSPGTFFSFMAAMALIYEPIRRVSRMNNKVQQALAAGERIFHILDTKNNISDTSTSKSIDTIKNSISFKSISYTYPKTEEPVLKSIDFTVFMGEVIAIVGSSGAGKSTLMDMIPRFYDPDAGSIYIDDTDIKSIKLNSLRSKIGIVTQETILFNDRISNNIAYGHKNATENKIINASKLAFAHDFIMAMPEGYNTIIGERGIRLSGGERQRLSIARAILKNPEILILDEATSNLDSESEALVQKALENLQKNKTTFIIAHRLSTIVNANRILVMDKGKVVETGTHSELLKNSGVYSSLYNLQYNNTSTTSKQ